MTSPLDDEADGSPFSLRFAETPLPHVFEELQRHTLDAVVAQLRGIRGLARPDTRRDTVLIIHGMELVDFHATRIMNALLDRGVRAAYLPVARFAEACQVSLSLGDPEGPPSRLTLPGSEILLEQVKSVWYRGRWDALRAAEPASGPIARWRDNELAMTLAGLYRLLDGAFWVNPPDALAEASNKVAQLRLAVQLGLRIPRTLVTSDPVAARDFFRRCDGRMIVKAFRRHVGSLEHGFRFIYTNRVAEDALEQMGRSRGPSVFQELVPKDVELRVTVIGRQVFASEIHSQGQAHTEIDFRRERVEDDLYARCVLPPEIERRCLAMMDHLRLSYAAFDLIRRPDGQHVFLEVNPDGDFLADQDALGYPVIAAMAGLLTDGPPSPG